MEVFIEKDRVEKILEDGEPVAIKYYAQFVFVDMNMNQQRKLGFDYKNAIIPISGIVRYFNEPKKIKEAILNSIQKKKQNYINRLRTKTISTVVVENFDGELSVLEDLENLD